MMFGERIRLLVSAHLMARFAHELVFLTWLCIVHSFNFSRSFAMVDKSFKDQEFQKF